MLYEDLVMKNQAFDTDDIRKYAQEVVNFFRENFTTDNLDINSRADGLTFKYRGQPRLFFTIKQGRIEIFLGKEVHDNFLKPIAGAGGQHRILAASVLQLLLDKDGQEYLRTHIQSSCKFCSL